MDAALFVVDRHTRADGRCWLMPDLGQDLDAKGPVAVERDKILRPHIVRRLCQHGDEGNALSRIPDLAAIGMVVGLMDVETVARSRLAIAPRNGRVIVPADDVSALYGLVAPKQQSAFRPH